MKKLTIFSLLLALVILLVWWLLPSPQPPQKEMVTHTLGEQSPATVEQRSDISQKSNSVMLAKTSPLILTTPEEIAAWTEKRGKQMAEDLEKGKDEWRTPIEFYGKVVDENSNAVSGVKIDFSCNDISETGTSSYHTSSDANGLFSLDNVKGKLLVVHVSKEGYYTSKADNDSFEYGDRYSHTVPDVSNPVVFHLRKKGSGEALIHFHKNFSVPKDGSPVLIDLATGNLTAASENALKIECWTHDTEKKEVWKYDWKCHISAPGGGLQTYSEQFPFLAPTENYIPTDEIDMTLRPGANWSPDVKRNYYIKVADGKFARITFRMIARGDHFCQIDSFFNPSGSRNLEPK